MKALLDTHVLIWWLERSKKLPNSHRSALERAGPQNPVLISDITLWEVAALLELGRIKLKLPLREWLERACAPPLVQRCGISPTVAAEVAALPSHFHRDPADRIIVATTRVFGATLLTCDKRILESRLVPTLS